MADRGSYRAVKVVLLDGPDFQQLSERANHLFVFLKLSFGPSGIEVHYPEALVHLLAERTRIPPDAVRIHLDELDMAGWVRRQGNVVWIVGQLEHDPHMKSDDEKHRKAIWKHLAGLPRLPIVCHWIADHPDWFEPREAKTHKGEPKKLESAPESLRVLGRAIEGPWKGLGRAIEAPKTEDRRPRTEDITNSRGRLNAENSSEHTLASVALEADRVLGMGAWGGELARKHRETKDIIQRHWMAGGVPLDSVYRAIHGLRAMIDGGEVEWLLDRRGKPVDGLEVLLKSAVVDGPDGSQMRPLFALAQEAYARDGPPQRKSSTGPRSIADILGTQPLQKAQGSNT